MTVQEQWDDAYNLADEMYKTKKPKKRSELDLLAQLVCARYDTIFSYNPYTDEYSFREQALQYGAPVSSKVRPIAEIDLDAIKENTLRANLEIPGYVDMVPVSAVAPSTLLVFAVGQPRAAGLTAALERAGRELMSKPSEIDIQPGAEFLYKHRDGRCFRVIVLREMENPSGCDEERKYEVAFLDVCQVICLKLKHFYMPLSFLTIDAYPCALFTARIRGIASMRSGYLSSWDENIREIYSKSKKVGVNAMVYKTDRKEAKLIVDFPAFSGTVGVTESEYLKSTHGYLMKAEKDPLGLTYEQLQAKEVVPLQYENPDNDEDHYDMPEMDELDELTDTSFHPSISTSDCPIGVASINNFFKQHLPSDSKYSMPKFLEDQNRKAFPLPHPLPHHHQSTSSRSSISGETVKSPMFANQRPLQAPRKTVPSVEISDDGSIPSFRSTKNNTPLPTFDVTERGDCTPVKVVDKQNYYSPDGWGDETPKKSPIPVVELEETLVNAPEAPKAPPTSSDHETKIQSTFQAPVEQIIVEKKPTASSSDGWGEETPKKSPIPVFEKEENDQNYESPDAVTSSDHEAKIQSSFHEPITVEKKPTTSSSDGWGEETHKKSPIPVIQKEENDVRAPEAAKILNPFNQDVEPIGVEKENNNVQSLKATEINLSSKSAYLDVVKIQNPFHDETPMDRPRSRASSRGTPVPLMSIKIDPPVAHKPLFGSQKPTGFGFDRDERSPSFFQQEKEKPSSSDAPILTNSESVEIPMAAETCKSPFGRPPRTPIPQNSLDEVKIQQEIPKVEEKVDVESVPEIPIQSIPPIIPESPIAKIRKNGSSVGGSAVKSIPALDIEDDVFEAPSEVAPEDPSVPSTPAYSETRQPNPFPAPSETSENNRLLSDAQERFNDFSDGESDAWIVPQEPKIPEIQEITLIEEKREIQEGIQEEIPQDLSIMQEIQRVEEILQEIEEIPKEIPHLEDIQQEIIIGNVQNDEKEGSVDDGLSVKSICPSEETEMLEQQKRARVIDEFAEVPESLKKLADAFMDAIQEAVFNKNRHAFNTELFILQSIALKSMDDVEHRFWKSKITVAKSMESAFD